MESIQGMFGLSQKQPSTAAPAFSRPPSDGPHPDAMAAAAGPPPGPECSAYLGACTVSKGSLQAKPYGCRIALFGGPSSGKSSIAATCMHASGNDDEASYVGIGRNHSGRGHTRLTTTHYLDPHRTVAVVDGPPMTLAVMESLEPGDMRMMKTRAQEDSAGSDEKYGLKVRTCMETMAKDFTEGRVPDGSHPDYESGRCTDWAGQPQIRCVPNSNFGVDDFIIAVSLHDPEVAEGLFLVPSTKAGEKYEMGTPVDRAKSKLMEVLDGTRHLAQQLRGINPSGRWPTVIFTGADELERRVPHKNGDVNALAYKDAAARIEEMKKLMRKRLCATHAFFVNTKDPTSAEAQEIVGEAVRNIVLAFEKKHEGTPVAEAAVGTRAASAGGPPGAAAGAGGPKPRPVYVEVDDDSDSDDE